MNATVDSQSASTSDPASNLVDRIRILEAECTIRDIAHCYCDAADRRDWERWLAVFHPGATYNYIGIFNGLVTDLAKGVKAFFGHIPETHHHLGNIEIRVRGDRAFCQSYLTAHHLIPAAAPVKVFPAHRAGVDEDWWVGGRYFDELEYRDGRWGIVHRTGVHDWHRWDVVDARGFIRNPADAPANIDGRLGEW